MNSTISVLRLGLANKFALVSKISIVAAVGILNDAHAQTLPFSFTQPASYIMSASATINGMAVPNGLQSTAWFQWGVRGNYGQTTDVVNVGAGNTVVRVSQPIAGLTNQGIYQFRLVVSNAMGTTFGAKQLLTTGLKMVSWGADGKYSVLSNGPNNVIAIASGKAFSLALTSSNGTVLSLTNGIFTNVLTNAVAISAGDNFGLALLTDGTVTAWGDNGNGQTNVPPGLSNIIQIYAGPTYGMALGIDGNVTAWGQWKTYFPQFTTVFVPAEVSNVVALNGAIGASAAIEADGRALNWGSFFGSFLTVLPDSNVVAEASGYYVYNLLKSDGTVEQWEDTSIQIASNAVAIAASNNGSLVLLENTTLLGFSTDAGYISSLNTPAGLSNVMAIAAGYYGGTAIGLNVAPVALGTNLAGIVSGQLTITLNGMDPNGDFLVFKIASLPNSGTLYQYENGNLGPEISTANTFVTDSRGRVVYVPVSDQYGSPAASFAFIVNDGETDSPSAAINISKSSIYQNPYAATQPATILGTSNAVLNGMTVPDGLPTTAWFEWGIKDLFDQITPFQNIGDGSSAIRMSIPISNLVAGVVYQCRLVASNAAAITRGAPRLFGFHNLGKIVPWGNNTYQQTTLPTGLTNVVSITAGGGNHSVALRADGTILAWGQNNYGQINVPPGLMKAVAIGAGDNHSLAVLADGTVVAWGWNNYGETNVPTGLSNVVSVAGGGDQSIALKSDGTVVAWGANDFGQATVPPGLSNVVAVAGGWHHSLALRVDGSVVAWGDNGGQITGATGLSNVVDIASAGGYCSIALMADGTVFGWGGFSNPQNVIFRSTTNAIAIGAGAKNVYALLANGTIKAWLDNTYGQTIIPKNLTNVISIAGGQVHVLALADNLPPVAQAFSISGYPNHDLLVQLKGSDTNGDSLSYQITSLPTSGKIFQFMGGSRGAEISIPNTYLNDLSARLIFAPDTNNFGSPYTTSTFVAYDGETNSTTATITINLVLPPAPQLSATGALWSYSSGFQIKFAGNSNATYRLWGSSNLLNWIPLGTATPFSNGLFQFIDSDASNLPTRFYKAGAP